MVPGARTTNSRRASWPMRHLDREWSNPGAGLQFEPGGLMLASADGRSNTLRLRYRQLILSETDFDPNIHAESPGGHR